MKAFLLLLLVLVGCTTFPTVDIGDQTIRVEIADTPGSMMRGLMDREELCDDCGMLFVFDQDRPQSFWMKNTLIPLTMVFIRSDGTVVDVLDAEPCVEDPCAHYVPKEDAQYVLEVNKGRLDQSILYKKATLPSVSKGL